ncbi:conjugal transfer TraA domain protein [Orientia chuto str. Dubai]|uniref:Conjugal transfer TraA domain protein n=1 Tax=Orientia chuto str. Dubai TaxID=1359168 RepID=A0A0F3MI21_9RICK|nr:hypothetical protein [Candidatus Orientia mediorientalis]KJV55102.1 conjugal transfer TraA domain protein [Orientia chuto str. Dubai]
MIEDMGDLRDRIANQAENIARDLLGEPNPHLSKNRELRWGKNGKIVCSTSGKYAGRWYDFSSGEGGDLFDLARREKSGDFVKAKEYLQSMVGMSTYSKQQHKETTQEVAPKDELFKIRKVQYFYNQSTPLYFGKY